MELAVSISTLMQLLRFLNAELVVDAEFVLGQIQLAT